MSQDANIFDHCLLNNVKLYLNFEFYPYDDLNLDFDKNRYVVLLICMRVLVNLITDTTISKRCSTWAHFCILWTFYWLLATKRIKSVIMDIRIEFECRDNTTAYCLILHDRVIEYYPLSNIVCKITYIATLTNIPILSQYKNQYVLQYAKRSLEKLFVMIAPTFVVCKDSPFRDLL